MKTKIYGFNNGGSPGWYEALAITEHGDIVGNHICSHEAYMPHDLGMDGTSTWKHEHYNKACPDGFETEYVPSSEIDNHAGLQQALKKAKDKQAKIPDEIKAGVTVELSDGTTITKP